MPLFNLRHDPLFDRPTDQNVASSILQCFLLVAVVVVVVVPFPNLSIIVSHIFPLTFFYFVLCFPIWLHTASNFPLLFFASSFSFVSMSMSTDLCITSIEYGSKKKVYTTNNKHLASYDWRPPSPSFSQISFDRRRVMNGTQQ